jgi:hypothetical protein
MVAALFFGRQSALIGKLRADPVSGQLQAMGVPFIFITGYDPEVIPAEVTEIPRLQKPVPFRSVPDMVSLL